MNGIITNLERRFNNFINEPRDWDFFIGLSEYVHYIHETPTLNDLIQTIMAQKAEDTKGLQEAETKALEAVRTAWVTVHKRVKEKGATTPLLDGLIKEYTNYDTGTTRALDNTPLAASLYPALADIVRELYSHNNGQYRNLVLDLVIGKIENSRFFIEVFKFGLPLSTVDFEKKVLESKQDTAKWYAWEQLNDAYIIFSQGWDYVKQKGLWDTKEFDKVWELLNIKILLAEKDKIRNDKTDGLHFFVRAKHRQYLNQINNYLFDKVEPDKKEVPDAEPNTAAAPDKFTLHTSYRQVYVNDFMIAIPHEGSDNKTFLDYVINQPANKIIERHKLPENIKTGTKSFIKILSALGFSGEIKKLFFFSAGKHKLAHRGSVVNSKDLKKFGVDLSLLLKQLDLKDTANRAKSISARTI